MKVLKDNYTKNECIEVEKHNDYPRKWICEECASELEYEKSDVAIEAFGCSFLRCPLCGYNNNLWDEDDLILTRNNVEFPTHFYHTSSETGAVNTCNNKEVKEAIHKAVEYFRKHKDEYDWMTAYGNMHVSVHRYSGDEVYNVIVTKDYYETHISFEAEDY